MSTQIHARHIETAAQVQRTVWTQRWLRIAAALLVATLIAMAMPAHAERLGDLAQVGGVRSNQLIGYGLVVGLEGSGDQTSQAPFTTQSIENMLQQFGVTVPANVRPQSRKAACWSEASTPRAPAAPACR